ncbi:TrkH family potassium uptake protein [Marinicauda pacifica]|uniref:TrkH family potassium uptake protein n=1 Tax=Marinicauda pacifica TaxID=1133559 RepID=UPI0035C86312
MNDSTRTVLLVLGVLLAALSVAKLVPAIVDLNSDAQSAHAFLGSAAVTGFVGVTLILMMRGGGRNLTARGAILVTGGSWAVLSVAAAVPLKLAVGDMSWTDALFEATSGMTTTGATVMTNLQDQPAGVLIWRSILQWIGGIGIIVTAMAIWPMLGIGGMQLFRLENSDKSDKALPRAGQIAAAVGIIYLVLTFICFLAYIATDMTPFDAAAHAMTTVATGGFSTHDGSIGAFTDGGSDIVALVFMILSALPFVLYLRAAQGRPDRLWVDPQVRGFLAVAGAAIAVLTVWILVHEPPASGQLPAWRLASVNAISIMTGTGYATADFSLWGGGAVGIFFCLMFIGGCAGSTTCSVKIFRYQIAAGAIGRHIERQARPHVVRPVRYGGKALDPDAVRSVMSFFFIFFATWVVAAALLSLIGLDPVTAISGAATSIANVGPGLGPIIGPAGTFKPLPDAAKWVMIVTMLIGRLEVFTMLVLLTPGFWRR